MIRVMIADDTLIAREGWKKILETVDDIEVVAEATVPEDIPGKLEANESDILLTDLKWFDDERVGAATIAKIREQDQDAKIIAVTVYPHLVDKAREAGADAILPKGFSRSELVDTIRAVHREERVSVPWEKRVTEIAVEYVEALEKIQVGRRDARRYEEFVEQVLSFLFGPHLTQLRAQSRTYGGTQIRDAILFNSSSHSFWSTVRQQHGAHIVFEVKNVTEPMNDHVLQLADYLKRPLGNFGIIVTRAAPSESVVRKLVETYKAHDKTILVLTDADIRAMLKAKIQARDPTDIVRQKYLDLVSLV